ncbi:MAG: fibronectin type III domain-containing protein [Dehalococcoidia bacterium]|nr:fibronectin type III domain-containing protein [Dehalococcoidia bacterium]
MKAKPDWHIVLFSVLALLSVCSFISCRPEPPAIVLFSATPSEINLGESTNLKWLIKDATNLTIDQGIGEVTATGSIELSPTKTTAYTLTATNAGGTVSKSVVIYVNPPPPPVADTTPPIIKSVLALSETETETVVTWVTNEPSSSKVEYGETTEYGSTATSDELTTTHSITLSNLEPNTTYYYRVKSKDSAENEASSTDNTFFTPQEKSKYSLKLESLEWGRRTEHLDVVMGVSPVEEKEYLFIKGALQNKSHAILRDVICTMNCWNGDTFVKYEVYVYHGPALPGHVFNFDIQTADDPTVNNVTIDFADAEGKEINVEVGGQ